MNNFSHDDRCPRYSLPDPDVLCACGELVDAEYQSELVYDMWETQRELENDLMDEMDLENQSE